MKFLMSNKFMKDDDKSTKLDRREPGANGIKNYMTPGGFEMLQTELRHLVSNERPEVVKVVSWAAGNGDRSENGDYIYGKKRLREIDRRIRYLTKRLETAKIVDPRLQIGLTQVFFGATVQYINEQGELHTIKIVGLDEATIQEGKISWLSPLAKSLLRARVGESRMLRVDNVEHRLTVKSISYVL